jgi:hypothetical protein
MSANSKSTKMAVRTNDDVPKKKPDRFSNRPVGVKHF